MKIDKAILIAIALPVFLSGIANAEENWTRFRGEFGTGHSNAKDVPTKWMASSVVWKTDLKGAGQSSPVNWGDKLFLTGASKDGGERYVFCLDRKSGKMLWEKTIPCSNPEGTHKMNSRATPSCATDGENVIAFFGPAGLHCFDLDGKEKWSLQLGDFPGSWGVAASPLILNGQVIQNCDTTGPSRLVAVNLKTGKIEWDTKREDKPRGGWSTPILIENGGVQELVLNGEFGVRGYDPKSGKEKWFCKAFNGRGAPVPDFSNGHVYVVNGKPGDTYSVKLGGSGDVTETHMEWHSKRPRGRDLPSPVVVGDFLFIANMSGVVSCYDAKTGNEYWSEPLGEGIQVAASPLVADGLVYVQAVDKGTTFVIKPGKTMEIVATNDLGGEEGEIFRATLAPIQGQIFARSHSRVYCIK